MMALSIKPASRLVTALVIVAAFAAAAAAYFGTRDPARAQTATTPGSVTYKYDSLGRAVQAVYPAQSEAYGYDNAGNRTSAAMN